MTRQIKELDLKREAQFGQDCLQRMRKTTR
jgi:hypothetical protein